MFNDGQYWERALTGDLREVLTADTHPDVPLNPNDPPCTRSQYITYFDRDGNKIAGVHQYLRPDGKIGLSGRPEPKRLLVDGVLYVPDSFKVKKTK